MAKSTSWCVRLVRIMEEGTTLISMSTSDSYTTKRSWIKALSGLEVS